MLEEIPPFPPPGGLIRAVRESCHLLRTSSNISIEQSSLERLLTSPAFVESFQRVSKSHGLAFPLKFSSLLEELNFLSVLALLNFASGYRVPLHERTGRGAWDNIRAFVFGAYLTASTGGGEFLSARGMKAIQVQNVAELMNVDLHVERPHESISGVVIGELGGPLYELAKLITSTLNETGDVLMGMGYPDLGSFILEALRNGEKVGLANGTGSDVDTILEQIVKGIPAFRDMAVINGHPVYVFKKALFLLHGIKIRFGVYVNKFIPVPDTSSLPIFSDNVVPSLLIYLGVIDLSSASENLSSLFPTVRENVATLLAKADEESATEVDVIARLPKPAPAEGPLLSESQAYILRAAAIDACEAMVDCAHSLSSAVVEAAGLDAETHAWIKNITLPDLDMWLWAVAKDRRDYRRLERFVLRKTVMF